MTVTIVEQLDGTRSGKIDAKSGTRTIDKNYIVTGTADINVAIAKLNEEIGAFGTTQVGVINHGAIEVPVVCTYYGSNSWSRLDTDTEGWLFTATFSNAPDAGQGNPANPNAGIEWVATTGSTRATTQAVYRVNPIATESDDPPVSTDIGGKKVDAGGTPTTITGIDRRFDTTHKLVDFPAIDAYSDIVATRNESAYENAPSGTVLYLGFSWSYDQGSGLWSITHQFAVDKETFHAEQVAKTDPQGDVIPDVDNTAGENIWRAKHVYWVQPFARRSFEVLPSFSGQ
tara:strand:+ start:1970 stop:2827 length:858 start_codon:yes stop_codon:yes gene_type:complete